MPAPDRLHSLIASPAAGFEEPFEMLAACHERIQRMLALLARLRAHLPEHGADAQAQQAARDILRYFDQAAPLHHQDEELHVFPPLLTGSEPRVAGLVRQLQDDHREMETRWQDARRVLRRIADGILAALAPEDAAALDAFAGLYDAHLRAEEQIAYPAAQSLLDAPSLQAMGQDMARRRGAR